MRFGKLIWLLVVLLIVALGWLLTDSGIDFMHQKFLINPTAEPERAVLNESGLSRLGGFLLATFRFEKANDVLTDAITLYPSGANYWFNLYRLAKVKEKTGNEREAAGILNRIITENTNHAKENSGVALDERLPNNNILQLRMNKIIEVYELRETETVQP